ncbi:TPA: hypothetical protein OL679_001838 [Klebsiella pneumoniae]|nr:hypothetical protein [Klebsiella pneumoniae]MDU4075526.1 hypothetical protein [Klebsiella pneumoniae]HBR7504849.1 hypothetical protein [Klebsiella pneumoniae]HCQ6978943.1 hypothetical protein [Klebsiella pneumoniae]
MTQPTKRPIILSQVQMAALEKIQNDEREKSPYGAAPSIPDIARGLIDIALRDVYADIENKKQLEELLKPAPIADTANKDFSKAHLEEE